MLIVESLSHTETSSLQGNYANYTCFPHKITPGFRYKTLIFYTCSVSPCRPVDEGSFRFLAGKLGSPDIPKRKTVKYVA